jgi:hypothetical protein
MELSGQLHTPDTLQPRERAPGSHWLGSLGGPQSRSGRGSGTKNSQPLPGLDPPIIQPIAQRYPGSSSFPTILTLSSYQRLGLPGIYFPKDKF